MDTLALDFRLALRRLARTPGFTLIAAFTLAIGIGATTAIYSVVDAALFRALPYPAADELAVVGVLIGLAGSLVTTRLDPVEALREE